MKKIYFLTLALFLTISLANSQSWRSSNQLYGTSDLSVLATSSDAYENTYIFGYFNGSITVSATEQIDSRGARDLFLAKYDPESNLLWIRGLGGTLNEFFSGGMYISPNDELFITGGFQSDFYYTDTDFISSTGLHDIFLAKFSLDGDAIWCRNVGSGASYQRSTALRGDADNNILLAGYFNDSISIAGDTTVYEFNNFKDYYIAKFEPLNGDFQWIKSFQSIDSDYSGFIYSIRATADSYYLSGVFGDSVRIGNDTIVSETQNYYDTHIIKSDTSGNIEWIRLIKGALWDYSYRSVIDAAENIYITGYFNSDQLTVDTNESSSMIVNSSGAGYDFFIAKYDSNGNLVWIRVNGGDGEDRLLRCEIFNNQLHVSGYFSDTLFWGGVELTTNGLSDRDMFVGSMDLDGNYRNANSFGGTSNSSESGIAVFNTTDAVYQIIQSNSSLLVLGDSIYTSSSGFNYIVIGVVGCLPISVDNTIPTNVTGCYGDSTGSIQVVASGGFGTPWQYSIDNGLSYTASAYYPGLPAGDYQVVVIDAEGCTEVGPLITLTQPDTLLANFISKENIRHHTDWRGNEVVTEGSLVVTATGGTPPYTYQLLPGGVPQALGTYLFGLEDSGRYVVAVNDLNNCGPSYTDSIDINVDRTTHIGEDDFENSEVKIYPNPTKGIVTIEMPFEDRKCRMEVVNMAGQTVLKRKVFPNGGFINETLDLSDQAKGLYMVRINGEALRSAIMVK